MEQGRGCHPIPKPGTVEVVEREAKHIDGIGSAIANMAYGIILVGLLIVPLLAVLVKEARVLLGWALQ